MRDLKQAVLDSLNLSDYPDAVKNFLTVALPADPGAPGSVEDAIIANGHLSNYLVAILKKFAGLTPIDLFLHAGQKNATLQAIALSGLELAKAANPHNYTIIAPVENTTYAAGVIRFEIQIISGIPDLNGATVKISGGLPEALEYTGDAGKYYYTAEMEAGTYDAEFTVVFKPDYWLVKTVNFSVG